MLWRVSRDEGDSPGSWSTSESLSSAAILMLESVLRVSTNNCRMFAVAIVDEQVVLVNALVVLRSLTCEDAFEAAIAAR
jgi:hypothetical protein